MDIDWESVTDTLATVFGVLFDLTKWLNGNVFSRTGGLVDIVNKVVDFFKNLFSGDGLGDIFGGGLDGIGDFFGGLFG